MTSVTMFLTILLITFGLWFLGYLFIQISDTIRLSKHRGLLRLWRECLDLTEDHIAAAFLFTYVALITR